MKGAGSAAAPPHVGVPLSQGTDVIVESGDARGWFPSMLGARCRILLHSDQVRGRVCQIEVRLRPNERTCALRHLATDLVANVLEGDVTLTSQSRARWLSGNSCAAVSRGADHRWQAGVAGARLLLTFSPGGIEALLRACLDRDPEDIAYVARTFGAEVDPAPRSRDLVHSRLGNR